MALLTSESHKVQSTKHTTTATTRKKQHQHQQKPKPKPKSKPKPKPKQQPTPSSWDQFKNLLTCKQMDVIGPNKVPLPVKNPNGYSKLSSCSSICNFKDVVHGNTRVVHRADHSPDSSTVGLDAGLLSRKKHVNDGGSSSSSKTLTGSSVRSNGHYVNYTSCSRGMQFRKLSGCYECHAIVDPSRYTIPRSTICVCSQCGEVFPKTESLEHHQAVRHAVSELGPEDSGRNIAEIIFKSSWLKKDHPIFTIERILKVQNTRRTIVEIIFKSSWLKKDHPIFTIQRFEDCRDAVKSRASATRCAADGNELLRFHCTTISCSLGHRNSSSLCSTVPGCGVCTIIRQGFQNPKQDGGVKTGVRTTASSGRAHDCLGVDAHVRRAMLVCRVIAGKVKRVEDDAPLNEDGEVYDSVAGYAGLYSNLEELYVHNPRAILPCFVVIYKALQS